MLKNAAESIAESVTHLLGFEVAAISIARDDHTLEMIAVAGSAQARAQLLGRRTPIAEVEEELLRADTWGEFRFVPQERAVEEQPSGWVPDIAVSEDPRMWHPMDLLVAPIYDHQRRLRGLLSVDLPVDRRRPGRTKREQLQRYAVQTRRAVLTELERAELAEQVRMADAARVIVRQASSELTMDRIVEMCQRALTAGFDAMGMWIQTFDEDGLGTDAIYGSTSGNVSTMPGELRQLGRVAAQRLWDRQEVAVATGSSVPSQAGLGAEEERQVLEFMAARQAGSLLFVPLGAGRECLGNLGLTRHSSRRAWSAVEKQVALDIGHDLGRALLNARTFERERRLREELRELAGYKSQLIATIAHELKNPLTSILGHAEILEIVPGITSQTRRSLATMERGAGRMQSLIDDLLVLAQASDPSTRFEPVPVDLGSTARGALDPLAAAIETKELDVTLELPDQPALVLGEPACLERLCANLISNAVTYTPRGGAVTISLSRVDAHAQLTVSDTGLGIPEADQPRLFEEFYRTSNPDAVSQPGVGLGLPIVKRILDRHNGTVRLDSTLGIGTTFSVLLPAAH